MLLKTAARCKVRLENYSWGTLRVIECGSRFSIVIHPSHWEDIMKGANSFRSEDGTEWKLRMGPDSITFSEDYGSKKVTVSLAELGASRKTAAGGYRDLSDAAETTGDDRYGSGRTEVWYMKPKYRRDLIMGPEWLRENEPELLPSNERDLSKTHVLIGTVDEKKLDNVFDMMQGFNWSPNAEARGIIQRLGLGHTSMMVGDVVKIGNQIMMVDSVGWEKVAALSQQTTDGLNRLAAHAPEELRSQIRNVMASMWNLRDQK